MDHPRPVRVVGEVVPVPVGPRPRRPLPAGTRQVRRAPPLPVRRTYLPLYPPQKLPLRAVLQAQLLQVALPTATLLAPPQGGHPWAARPLWTSPGPTRTAPPGPPA